MFENSKSRNIHLCDLEVARKPPAAPAAAPEPAPAPEPAAAEEPAAEEPAAEEAANKTEEAASKKPKQTHQAPIKAGEQVAKGLVVSDIDMSKWPGNSLSFTTHSGTILRTAPHRQSVVHHDRCCCCQSLETSHSSRANTRAPATLSVRARCCLYHLTVDNWKCLAECTAISLSVQPSHSVYNHLTRCTAISLGVQPSHSVYSHLTQCTAISLGVQPSHSVYNHLTRCTAISLGVQPSHSVYNHLTRCTAISLENVRVTHRKCHTLGN